jgi:hypothetical protein
MKFGAIRVGVRNMNSNVRPTIFLKRVSNYYVIHTPNGLVLGNNKTPIRFPLEDLDKAGAMVMAIRKSTGQF